MSSMILTAVQADLGQPDSSLRNPDVDSSSHTSVKEI